MNFYHKEYYLQNKQKIKNYLKIYRQVHRERLIEYSRAYYKKYRQRCQKNSITWKKNNIPNYGLVRIKPQPFKKINQHIILTFD